MTDAPRVSVVIPCYNQGRFLAEAIESVLAQSRPPLEIVVVDDGSTDETPEVAARYPQVRCVRQENQGLAAARNAGLAASRGDLLLFLDADDRLLPDALAVHLEDLAAHPECAVVAGGHVTLHADGSPPDGSKWRGRRVLEPQEAYEALLLHVYHLGSAMIRREALEYVEGFDTRLRVCEDFDLELRVARHFHLYWHDRIVAEYRRHEDNMSNDIAAMWRGCVEVYQAQWAHIVANARWEDNCRSGLKRQADGYARKLLMRLETSAEFDPEATLLEEYRARYSASDSRLERCIWELALARLAADKGVESSFEVQEPVGEDGFGTLMDDVHAELLRESDLRARSVRAFHRLIEGELSEEIVGVISRGDPCLVERAGPRVVHFPGDDDGRWTGHYPASSDEAIAALSAARRRGVTALVVPATSNWWLTYYGDFAAHLESVAGRVIEAFDGTRAFCLSTLSRHDTGGSGA